MARAITVRSRVAEGLHDYGTEWGVCYYGAEHGGGDGGVRLRCGTVVSLGTLEGD